MYILHNRVQDIQEVANEISLLVPEASVFVGHGQMPAGELDNVMDLSCKGNATFWF